MHQVFASATRGAGEGSRRQMVLRALARRHHLTTLCNDLRTAPDGHHSKASPPRRLNKGLDVVVGATRDAGDKRAVSVIAKNGLRINTKCILGIIANRSFRISAVSLGERIRRGRPDKQKAKG